ncbi:MAG: SET domain-containing protein-lysine N-methyltransferase [Kangiellaceae bacterium]|jgi:hypothetical protein|nr:SET domain-containing protein-lysine N-methyltransferase [Kangiellaceae bacterium]
MSIVANNAISPFIVAPPFPLTRRLSEKWKEHRDFITNLERCILVCFHNIVYPTVEIRQTERRGRGVFTKIDLPKNTLICHYAGWRHPRTELMIAKEDAHTTLNLNHRGEKWSIIGDPHRMGPTMNHGVPGNIDPIYVDLEPHVANSKTTRPAFEVILVTNRNVEANEELLFNYRSIESKAYKN